LFHLNYDIRRHFENAALAAIALVDKGGRRHLK
jgi:hypothetical protein